MLVPQNFTWGIGGRVKRLYTWYLAIKEWREERVYDFLAWHDHWSKRVFGRDPYRAAFMEGMLGALVLAPVILGGLYGLHLILS
jgi:hypothetical protein